MYKEVVDARQDFIDDARNYICSHPIGTQLTVDDVREVIRPPEGLDPRVMGCLFKLPGWRAVGYRKSTRATSHYRPISIFERVA